jgi:hypothetical protein
MEGSPAIPPPDDHYTVDEDEEGYITFTGNYVLARCVVALTCDEVFLRADCQYFPAETPSSPSRISNYPHWR